MINDFILKQYIKINKIINKEKENKKIKKELEYQLRDEDVIGIVIKENPEITIRIGKEDILNEELDRMRNEIEDKIRKTNKNYKLTLIDRKYKVVLEVSKIEE